MRRASRTENYELRVDGDSAVGLDTPPDDAAEGVSLAFPEGGRDAWTCLLGSFLLMFPSFGFQTAGKKI